MNNTVEVPSIYQLMEIPESTKDYSITEKEAKVIFDFVKNEPIHNSLEVGLAYGCSAAHIMAATNGVHYAIDPFQHEFDDLGLKNIEHLGFKKRLRFLKEYSHFALPKLAKEGVKLDFAFIDGGHKFDDIFIDFYFIDLMMNIGGHVMLHDYWMPSSKNVVSWIKKNRLEYQLVPTADQNIILLKKQSVDKRKWYHFKLFGLVRTTI